MEYQITGYKENDLVNLYRYSDTDRYIYISFTWISKLFRRSLFIDGLRGRARCVAPRASADAASAA